MARMPMRLALLALLSGLAPTVLAGTLDSKTNEWAFDVSWTDIDNVGSVTNIDGEWGYLFGKGTNELGLFLSYLSEDPDSGSSQDAMILGPAYTWNWMPDKKATGYINVGYGFVSGDLGDFYDDAWQAAIGAKIFVGDSAAVRIQYFMTSLMGSEGIEDLDANGIAIGISIFTGNK